MIDTYGFESCVESPTWDQLGHTIRIDGGQSLDYATAKSLADREAQRVNSDPMLLAWYEAKTGKFSPVVECCCHERKKPAWLIYAEVRGGDIQVVINDLEYVFIYRPETAASPR